MESKTKVLYKVKEGSKEWKGKIKTEGKRVDENIKCLNCGSLKHSTKEHPSAE